MPHRDKRLWAWVAGAATAALIGSTLVWLDQRRLAGEIRETARQIRLLRQDRYRMTMTWKSRDPVTGKPVEMSHTTPRASPDEPMPLWISRFQSELAELQAVYPIEE